MNPWISKCLLSLAVLQGIIPADQCVLRLAGLCNCGDRTVVHDSCCCCCDESPAQKKHCNHNESENRNNSCCAYTPAHGLTVEAPAAPSVDLHQDFLAAPAPMLAILQDCVTPSIAAPAFASPQSPDTPLFLRVRTFLI